MFCALYRGYEITESKDFEGLWRIVSPSKKFISLSTNMTDARKIVDSHITNLLKGV